MVHCALVILDVGNALQNREGEVLESGEGHPVFQTCSCLSYALIWA